MIVSTGKKDIVVATIKDLLSKIADTPGVQNKLPIAAKIFGYLLKRECNDYLFTHAKFASVVKAKCYEFLDQDIRTFTFVSPVVQKYFSDDSSMLTRLRRARNHWQRKKRNERRRKVSPAERICPNCGYHVN